MTQIKLMTLCRKCHQNLHLGIWEMIRSEREISVIDKNSGERVMRLLTNQGLDVPALQGRLNLAEESLSQLLDALP